MTWIAWAQALVRDFLDRVTARGGKADAQVSGGAPDYVAVHENDEKLPEAVFAAECRAINDRRAHAGLPQVSGARPSTRLGLVGLALSGGGIRSATFNLGMIQALHKHGVLRHVDYLSTVSGGGYLGSAISALAAAAPPPERTAFIVSGLMEGARLARGIKREDGAWYVAPGDAAGIELILPREKHARNLRIAARAVAVGNTGDAAADARPVPLAAVLRPRHVPDQVKVAEWRHEGGIGLVLSAGEGTGDGEIRLPLTIASEAFPFVHHPGVVEGDAFRHLRDSSNYLIPKDFLAGLRLPALFLRGLLVNLSIVLPVVLVAVLATLWVSGGLIREALQTDEVEVAFTEIGQTAWLTQLAPDGYRLDLAAGAAAAAADSGIAADHAALVNLPRGIVIDGDTASAGDMRVFNIRETPSVVLSHSGVGEERPALRVRLWQEASGGRPVMDPISGLHDIVFTWLRLGVVGMLVVLALLPAAQRLANWGTPPDWKMRDRATRWLGGGAVFAILVMTAVLLQPLAIYYFHALGDHQIHGLGDVSEVATLVWTVVTAVGALFSGTLAERVAGLWGRIGLRILGLMGPVILWLLYLNLCRWALAPDTAPLWLDQAATTLGDALRRWQAGNAGDAGALQAALGLVTAAIAFIAGHLDNLFSWAADEAVWLTHSADMALLYGVAAALVTLVTQFFYDVNATSFHRFYRDRLSRAFLMDVWRRDGAGHPAHNDAQRLSALDTARAPYHIINTTLNVQRSRRANMRGRNGAFFIMSREYVGGQLTGYRRTDSMERLHRELDLATAMAISGAAAAPNMGRNTVKGLTFALTLLNIRLGYWLPHPRTFTAAIYARPVIGPIMRALVRAVMRVTPWHLIREMLGDLDEDGRHVNLTDGGHLENLGLHELLRRRCRVIIAGDAEADPSMKFQGLADAIRFARIDLGVTIDIDIDPIRPDPATGLSHAHCAVGRINYGDGEKGWLFYVKSSLTGDENVYIEKYKAEEPTFPSQTTADQFFDEEQFEAYRSLGHHAAESVLARHLQWDPLAPGNESLVDGLKAIKGKALV